MNKLLKIEREMSVGIWDNLTESITIYKDRTVIKSHGIKWKNNNGTLVSKNTRIIGKGHEAFLQAIENAENNDVGPDDYIWDVLFNTA